MSDSISVMRSDFNRMQNTLADQGRTLERQGRSLTAHIVECAGLNGEVRTELEGLKKSMSLHTKVMLAVGGAMIMTLLGLTGTLLTAMLHKGGIL